MTKEIRILQGPGDFDSLRPLLQQYANERQHGFCFASFEKELAELPGSSTWFGAFEGNELCGCVAITPLDSITCKMRRLYVDNPYRSKRYGLGLAKACIEHAKSSGYATIEIHTVADMEKAIDMYKRFGFIHTGYRKDTPVMKMTLSLGAKS